MFDVCAPRVTRRTSIRYSSSCHRHVATTWFLLAQTSSFSKLFIPRTNGLVCRRVLCVLFTKCTLRSNHRLSRVIFQHTKRLLPQSGPIFSLHTLVSPSGRNVNYDEKQLAGETIFELFLLSVQVCKYVSCGFPIINFCNPRIHYETPCISLYKFLMICYKECVRIHVVWRKRWD